jgi:hypothetical protein
MIPRESALCTIGCEYISLGSFVRHSHCAGFCLSRSHGLSLACVSSKALERIWHGQNLLIFVRFHGMFLGSQHEMWSKQHNGKVSENVTLNEVTINGIQGKQIFYTAPIGAEIVHVLVGWDNTQILDISFMPSIRFSETQFQTLIKSIKKIK